MYFCYFDESGNTAWPDSNTWLYVLAAVLVHDRDWAEVYNASARFRSELGDKFAVEPTTELKGSWLAHGAEDFSDMPLRKRAAVYNEAMWFQQSNRGMLRVFAAAVPKHKTPQNLDIKDAAWQLAIESINNFGKRQKENMHLLPDEGNRKFLMEKFRTMRRPDCGAPSTDITNIVEDPSDRKSHESFFIQLADLNAYAAAQKIRQPADANKRFTNGHLWDVLGDARIKEVNSTDNEPVGIRVWTPRKK